MGPTKAAAMKKTPEMLAADLARAHLATPKQRALARHLGLRVYAAAVADRRPELAREAMDIVNRMESTEDV
jgi:hypothetical protein